MHYAHGVNIGDVTNNWTGRLMKKYADQTTTVRRARRLAEWLMHDSGVKWLMWLVGNHDAWENGDEILRRIAPAAQRPSQAARLLQAAHRFGAGGAQEGQHIGIA